MVTMALEFVVVAREQHLGFEIGQKLGITLQFAIDFAVHLLAFAGEFE